MRMKAPTSRNMQHFDGTGTKSKVMHTGHGAPAQSASGRGNSGRILPNNWGSQQLSKMTRGGSRHAGQNRFVQPTDSATAVVPPGGLGNPRGID